MSRTTITNALIVTAACGRAGRVPRASEETGNDAATQVALVEVQPAQVRPMQESVTAYGSAEASADRAEAVTIDVEAMVAQVLVTSGEPVHRGQPLLGLKPSAGSRLEADKAARDASAAITEAERVSRLHALGLATNAELASARAAANSAAELRDSLHARIGHGAALPAPRAGVVDGLKAQPGDLLAAGTVVAASSIQPPASFDSDRA
jgi:biotin carboxyl carrier protein